MRFERGTKTVVLPNGFFIPETSFLPFSRMQFEIRLPEERIVSDRGESSFSIHDNSRILRSDVRIERATARAVAHFHRIVGKTLYMCVLIKNDWNAAKRAGTNGISSCGARNKNLERDATLGIER